MSVQIREEDFYAAQQYANHHNPLPTLPTEAELRSWLEDNQISIPGRGNISVPFRQGILTLLRHHVDGVPIPPPFLSGRKRPTRRPRRRRLTKRLFRNRR